MQAITHSCILILWMQTLTSVKSEAGCTLQQFTDGNLYDDKFDISNMEASYTPGRSVKVNCRVGYSGFFKLICTQNGWDHKGKKCEPKPCGHPGEAAFADFTLEKEPHFVFGSKVVYTCNTGYQMISRINYRNCLSEGWDGAVPVCEAIQCPQLHVEDNVQVNGESLEATHGNVVRFQCKFNYEVLLGSQETYCNEKGEWSSLPPKCEEIKCLKPAIENGIVRRRTNVYKENEFLDFDCNTGFVPTNGIAPKCTKVGMRAEWTPTPSCEPIRCKLTLPPVTGTSYHPEYMSRFIPGQNVTVTCGDEYWISDILTTSVTATCGKDGKWSINPICKEVRCNLQHSHPAYRWDWMYRRRYSLKIHETHGYQCYDGYKKPAGVRVATCTRRGFIPDPLCEAIQCTRKDIPNTELMNKKDAYAYGESANYKCTGRKTGQFTFICRGDEYWDGRVECEEITCSIDPNPSTHTWNEYWPPRTIQLDRALGYECKQGYRKPAGVDRGATCTKEGLKPHPLCEDVQCEKKVIPNTRIVNEQGKYYPGGRAEYKCINGYEGEFHLHCLTTGQWSGTPKCTNNTQCTKPTVSDAVTDNDNKESYKQNDRVRFRCSNNESRVFDIVCHNGKWTGIQICSGCITPEITNGFAEGPYNETLYYTCDDGYKLITEGWWAQAKCDKGKWVGLQNCIEKNHCGPVSPIPNGKVSSPQPSYGEREQVRIDCETGFKPEITHLTCENGEWHPKDKPLKSICTYAARPCSPPAKVENAVIKTHFQNIYLSGSEVTYVCLGSQEETKITCTDGEWEETTIICTPPSKKLRK